MGPDANSTARRRVVALATAADAWAVDDDATPLLAALRATGVDAHPAVWDDPSVHWAGADLVVLRSTWDYARRRPEFLKWADRVAAVTRLHNPPGVLRWNTDKRYLADLAAAGIAVVGTHFIDPGASADGSIDSAIATAIDTASVNSAIDTAIDTAIDAGGDVVVKPSVSAGSKDTGRFGPGDREAAGALAAAIVAEGRTAMVQPYLASVDERGETGLVYFDGRFSHAFEKGPLLAPGGAVEPGLFALEAIAPRVAAGDELDLGRAVVDRVVERFGEHPLYARVDLLRDDRGAPVVLELELTEPSWFLDTDPGAAGRAASAIRDRLR